MKKFSFKKVLQSLLLFESDDILLKRKVFIFNSFTLISTLAFILMMLTSFFTSIQYSFNIGFVGTFVFLSLFLFMRKTKKLQYASMFLTIVYFVIIMVFLQSNHQINYGIIWLIFIPLATFSLVGGKKGIILAYFLNSVIVMYLIYGLFLWDGFTVLAFIRIMIAFIAMNLFIYISEYTFDKLIGELDDSVKLLDSVIRGANLGYWDWYPLKKKNFVNDRWLDILGLSRDDINNTEDDWKNRVHKSDIRRIYASVIRAFRDSKPFIIEYRLLHKDGHYVWVQAAGSIIDINSSNEATRISGTLLDVTEFKKIEAEKKILRLQNAHQAQIIEQIHDSVISTDLNGIIQNVNHATTLLLGYKKSEILNEHIKILTTEQDFKLLKSHLRDIVKKGEFDTEICLIKKTGDRLRVDSSLSILKDDDDNPIGIIGYSKDITKRKIAENELKLMASTDSLTKLYNRRYFYKISESIIDLALREQTPTSIMMLDIDNFKKINDNYGHKVGDEVIKVVAKVLLKLSRKSDIVSRWGGEEFLVLLPNTDADGAIIIAQKIRVEIEEFIINLDTNEKLKFTISIGVSELKDEYTKLDTFINTADEALYDAKEGGKNKVCAKI